jgi:SET domain
VSNLFSREYRAKDTDPPLYHSFLVERIISLNVFGCPLSSLQTHIKPSKKEEHYHHSCGIWLKASYINHSCHSNVRRSFIGDLMLVRATCDMPADTELKFCYQLPGAKSYQETQRGLKTWAFECDCAICTDAKSTPNKTANRRKALVGDLLTVLQNPARLDAPKADRLAAAIEATYKSPASEVPRLALWEPYLLITRAYATASQPVGVVSTALKFLRSLSFVIKGADPPFSSPASFEVVRWGLMIDNVIEIWMHLWTAYAAIAPQFCTKAEECARIAYRICVGWDETFEERCGKRAREAIQDMK